MNIDELKMIFKLQIDNDNSTLTEDKFYKLKNKVGFRNCGEVKIGDKILFFVLSTVHYKHDSIKKNIKKGDLIKAYKKLQTNKISSQLCMITEDYLNRDDCELLNFKVDNNQQLQDLMYPRLIELNRIL